MSKQHFAQQHQLQTPHMLSRAMTNHSCLESCCNMSHVAITLLLLQRPEIPYPQAVGCVPNAKCSIAASQGLPL